MSVVIPWRSDDPERTEIFHWVLARWTALFPAWPIVTPHDGETEGAFNRSRAVNRGVAMTDSEVVVIADADIAVRPEQVGAMALRLMDPCAWWVLGFTRMIHLRPNISRNLLRLPPELAEIDNPVPPHRIRWQGHDSVCGLLAIRREDFDAIGGFDDRFQGWGGDDTSFAMKADTLVGRVLRVEGDVAHLFHALRPDRKTDSDAVANYALEDRYKAANGDPEAMTALVRESLGA